MEEKVLEKVKKLLALSNDSGSSKEESQTALLLAQQMMVKNNLTMQDIKTIESNSSREIVHGITQCLNKTPWWYQSLSTILADNFKCVCIKEKFKGKGYSCINFVGHPEDVDICKEIYFYAVKQITYLSDRYSTYYTTKIARVPKPGIKNDYITGYLFGIKTKFDEQVKKNDWGLIVTCDNEVLDTLKGCHKVPNTKAKSGNTIDALTKGYSQGLKFTPTVGAIE